MAGREYSIAYKFKGDASGFQKAVGQMSKDLSYLQKSTRSITSTFRSVGRILGVAFSFRAIANFGREAVRAAIATGNIGSEAQKTILNLQGISTSWQHIKANIGKAILEGEGFQAVIGRINTITKNIAERGFLSTLFEKRETWEKRQQEKYKWDVDRYGFPVKRPEPFSVVPVVKPENVKTIADYVAQIKKGAEESAKMAKAWEIIRGEISGGMKPMEKIDVKIPRLAGKGIVPELAGPPKTIIDTTEALEKQMDIAKEMTGVFEDMFSHMDEGFKGMMGSLLEYFKMLAIKLLALGVTYAALSLIPGFSAFMEAVGGFNRFVGGGLPGGKMRAISATQNMNIAVNGKISARDIHLSGTRYSNVLTGHT